jgi:hypothetical protein
MKKPSRRFATGMMYSGFVVACLMFFFKEKLQNFDKGAQVGGIFFIALLFAVVGALNSGQDGNSN